MANAMEGWAPLKKHPGVYEKQGQYRIRVRAMCEATGKLKPSMETFDKGTNLRAVLQRQLDLKAELRLGAAPAASRRRVGDFAKSWLSIKLPALDLATAERYTASLEDHALKSLGDYYYDALTSMHVQEWVNEELKAGYAVETVRGHFRVFRSMTRDAMGPLRLTLDPTLRIAFPDSPGRQEANALLPDQLRAFLAEMERAFYRNYALTCVLAFTGLRFCHASALRWDDIDEDNGTITITRKNIRGRIGNVSRKKRAPKTYPLDPTLAEILREHRQWMIYKQYPGLESGYCFPSRAGTLRCPSSLHKAWKQCIEAIELGEHFTVHGLRRTFNDLGRRAKIDPTTIKSLTGHVTEQMREHYSSVGLDEKRSAVTAVMDLVMRKGRATA